MSHALFQFLNCKKDLPTSDPLVVTQLGFWPGSISSMSYVFVYEVFLNWELFQKESPGSSEVSFEVPRTIFYMKGTGMYTRPFEILGNNDSLCLQNIIRVRYFKILETGRVFTVLELYFVL